MLHFKWKNKKTRNFWLFEKKTSLVALCNLCKKYQRSQVIFCKKESKMPLSKWTLASLNCKSIHFTLFLHLLLTQLWKVVVFSLNLNTFNRFEMGITRPAWHWFAIFSDHCLHFTIVVNGKRHGCIRLPVKVNRFWDLCILCWLCVGSSKQLFDEPPSQST